MTLRDLMNLLDTNKDATMSIKLPCGNFIPAHFHITEVGKVRKDFIDCGGTIRKKESCVLQVWSATDVEHRLLTTKLLKILKLGEQVLDSNDLSVEVEYGEDVASNYLLDDIEMIDKVLLLKLVGKQTDCLAPDKCGVTSPCCSSRNCC